jgi:transposase
MFTKSLKVTDFTGQNIYVGLDVHFKSWMVSIYSDEFELKTFNQSPNVDQLADYLSKHYPNADYHLAYEAGFCGFWVQRSFAQKGLSCQVIHSTDVPGTDKERKRKTDKVDSRKIARGLKNQELNAIFIPDEAQEADRQLLRSRGKIVRDITSIKNRIKAFLKLRGLTIPAAYGDGNWHTAFMGWLGTIAFAQISHQVALRAYLEELTFLMQQEKQLGGAIKELASNYYADKVKLLRTIPSIGLIAAMTLLTELGDINRFKKPDHLSSYCGLTPNSHDSGPTTRVGGMSRRGNPIVKRLLIECAWIAVRKDPALLLYYKQQLPRMNANKAIVKIAHKLLNRIRFVLKQQKEYVIGVVT